METENQDELDVEPEGEPDVEPDVEPDAEPEEDAEPEIEEEPPEFDEAGLATVEKIASKMGYAPNYDGPNKRSPLEFILEGKKIQASQSKSIRDKLKHIDTLNENVAEVVKFVRTQDKQKITTLEDKVKELQVKREEAVVIGDLDTFKETETLIAETQGEIEQNRTEDIVPKPDNEGQGFQEAYEPWVKQNDWYSKDAAMTAYADTFKTNPAVKDLNDSEYLEFVATEVKKEFPHKFQKPAPTRQTVAGGGAIRSGKAVPKKGNPEATLSRQQIMVLDDYERMLPDFDRKGYAAEMATSNA